MGVPGGCVDQPGGFAPTLRRQLDHDGPSLTDVAMENSAPTP